MWKDRIGTESIERSRPLSIAGREIRRLEDHDLVGHLLVHHFSHYFDRRLKWLVDLGHVASQPGFRWEEVARRIESWRAGAACRVSLVHLHKLWPELIGQRPLDLMPVAPWRSLVTWPLRSSHPLELFRGTRNRRVQLFLAAVMLEGPLSLPGWWLHRRVRDDRRSENPLDPGTGAGPHRS